MKKLLHTLIIVLMALWCNLLTAQTGWTSQINPLGTGESAILGKVQFVSETEGWISCGNGGLLHTTNAGEVWNFLDPFPADTVERFSDPSMAMSWVGNSHGWVIGTLGSLDEPRGAVIYYSTNSGQQWQKKILSTESGTMGIQIQFADQNTGWALLFNFSASTATFIKTTDGGNTWVPFNGRGIFCFVDVNNGWAYSSEGPASQPPVKIYKTTDGGNNWVEQFSDASVGTYNAIMFTDNNNGWVVGDSGKVLRTTDGGSNWNYVLNTGVNVFENCKTVFFLNANTGWIPSKQNDIFSTPYLQHTTNGGITWVTQLTPFGDQQGSNAVFSIYFVNEQTGWITGDRGRIARYYGVTDVKDEVNHANQFSLEQNYPNPFNPSTIIKYSVSNKEYVSLKVYNVLGNEIAVLVNDEKPEGTYDVEFRMQNLELSSGIYFYQLKAGNYSATRKMLLVK